MFKTGVLTETDDFGISFGHWLGIPDEHLGNPLSAAAWWVNNGEDRRWRVINYYLDRVGETQLSDELMPFSEPPPGVRCVPITSRYS